MRWCAVLGVAIGLIGAIGGALVGNWAVIPWALATSFWGVSMFVNLSAQDQRLRAETQHLRNEVARLEREAGAR